MNVMMNDPSLLGHGHSQSTGGGQETIVGEICIPEKRRINVVVCVLITKALK